MDEDDLILVRRAVAAYFRAAAAFGAASLLLRHAAGGLGGGDVLLEPGDEPDDEFLLQRAQMYRDKALLMSESAVALLGHADRWFAELPDVDADPDELLDQFAVEIQAASDATAEVGASIASASFAHLGTYPQLLDEARHSVRFLSMETALFAALACGELDDEEPDDELDPRRG